MPSPHNSQRWRCPPSPSDLSSLRLLLLLQFLLITTLLALFGHANPNTYRSKLQFHGFQAGLNEAPGSSSASPRLVWSQFLTTYNLNLTIACFLIYILHLIAHILEFDCAWPIAGLQVLLVTAWGVSIGFTAAGRPWWLVDGCSVGSVGGRGLEGLEGFCREAQAGFWLGVLLGLDYFAVGVLALVSISRGRPGPEGKENSEDEVDESV